MRARSFSGRPKRSLGQNFLVDKNIALKIVDALSLAQDDIVIEIGPGRGILTRYLAERVETLYAVELDGKLAEALKSEYSGEPSVQIITENFLNFDLNKLGSVDKKIRLVGNVPYNISSQIVFKALQNAELICDMTLMLQKEVAQRVVAGPRSKAYGILAIQSQIYAEPQILFHVSPTVFRPRPKVESSVVKWDFYETEKYILADPKYFTRFLKAVFSQRRKILKNSLKQLITDFPEGLITSYDLNRRPEELSVSELVELGNQLFRSRLEHLEQA